MTLLYKTQFKTYTTSVLSILQIVLFFFIMNLSFAKQTFLPLRKTCLKSKQAILQPERILIMPEYKKVGYLTTDFKMFHLKDEEMRTFHLSLSAQLWQLS